MHKINPLRTSFKTAESPTSKNEMRCLEGGRKVDGRTDYRFDRWGGYLAAARTPSSQLTSIGNMRGKYDLPAVTAGAA
jgi:hypothetical protein